EGPQDPAALLRRRAGGAAALAQARRRRMSVSRHLVDPEIEMMLEMPNLELTAESLPEIRANPLFTGAEVPPPPFPIGEAFAPARDGPDVRLVVMNPPSAAKG